MLSPVLNINNFLFLIHLINDVYYLIFGCYNIDMYLLIVDKTRLFECVKLTLKFKSYTLDYFKDLNSMI